MGAWTPERRARQAAMMRAKWQDAAYAHRTKAEMSRAAREEAPPLTPEQAVQFARLVRAGVNGREIARRIGTSYWRVCSHAFGVVQKVMQKGAR